MKALTAALRSPKTTGLAILAAFTAWGGALHAVLDGDAATTADWDTVMTLTLLAIGMLFSRDADVTSETSGAN